MLAEEVSAEPEGLLSHEVVSEVSEVVGNGWTQSSKRKCDITKDLTLTCLNPFRDYERHFAVDKF